mmetsp:Transcript_83634/g.270340  ORF Transcript_83634/g.270340 Transcript_83634/m.270340 type:complete len:345 (+) Transcript_83634:676-1710(+)
MRCRAQDRLPQGPRLGRRGVGQPLQAAAVGGQILEGRRWLHADRRLDLRHLPVVPRALVGVEAAHRPPLLLVAVQEALAAPAAEHSADLPSQVVHILHAGVLPVAAAWREAVAGVASQEDAARAVGGCDCASHLPSTLASYVDGGRPLADGRRDAREAVLGAPVVWVPLLAREERRVHHPLVPAVVVRNMSVAAGGVEPPERWTVGVALPKVARQVALEVNPRVVLDDAGLGVVGCRLNLGHRRLQGDAKRTANPGASPVARDHEPATYSVLFWLFAARALSTDGYTNRVLSVLCHDFHQMTEAHVSSGWMPLCQDLRQDALPLGLRQVQHALDSVAAMRLHRF